MSKYGWTKGTGLGADESGILNPLRVQVEKRKKKSDAEGGGWAEPAPRSKILGGKRKAAAGGDGEGGAGGPGPGSMSEVIVLRNMLEGMEDLRGEVAAGLGQEIGEECGDKVPLSPQSPVLQCRIVCGRVLLRVLCADL
jgi:splicing factor 45